jgi:hypothetical protein
VLNLCNPSPKHSCLGLFLKVFLCMYWIDVYDDIIEYTLDRRKTIIIRFFLIWDKKVVERAIKPNKNMWDNRNRFLHESFKKTSRESTRQSEMYQINTHLDYIFDIPFCPGVPLDVQLSRSTTSSTTATLTPRSCAGNHNFACSIIS